MEKFTVLTGVAAPMLMTNINTDLIAPSLMPGKYTRRSRDVVVEGKMFANLRFDKDGVPRRISSWTSRAFATRASCWPVPISAAAVRARRPSGR